MRLTITDAGRYEILPTVADQSRVECTRGVPPRNYVVAIFKVTLPNEFAPENQWLEDEIFLVGIPYLQGRTVTLGGGFIMFVKCPKVLNNLLMKTHLGP